MNTAPIIHLRKNYRPHPYTIEKVDLKITLGEEVTQVASELDIVRKSRKPCPLVLDGEAQKLCSVELNGRLLDAEKYTIDAEHLTIHRVPPKFHLKIISEIKPQENTSLEGLYKSGPIFCTQCESEGFRKITYFIDRPDNLSLFTTTIIGNQKKYPYLLSNGNPVASGKIDNETHWVKWEDPFKKPSYLFALVAGDLDVLEDHFVTQSGRKVTLKIFHEKGQQHQCLAAMSAVKKAMAWDEKNYGREYDLDLFMIVALQDFNSGAMENKGLNLFNAKYIYVDPKTATDLDYQNVDRVVAHEYFHNWTGDRISCRDWFQLSLKEGLTVFRDQSFGEDVTENPVFRIAEVKTLRSTQFLEDASPLAHAVRPESYQEIRNFYTTTIYEKGAEIYHMLQSMLGKDGFRKGMDLYFTRFDGQAVTCDDLIQAMSDANGVDLKQFMRWYNQAGTPELKIQTQYQKRSKKFKVTIEQYCPPTPRQPKKEPFHIPLAMALWSPDGQLISGTEQVLSIKRRKQTFVFSDISAKPIASFLRGFSAPVKVKYDHSDDDLRFLMLHETDAFARWEAAQCFVKNFLLKEVGEYQKGKRSVGQVSGTLLDVYRQLLQDDQANLFLRADLLALPTYTSLFDSAEKIDIDALFYVRENLKGALAKIFKEDFLKLYQSCQSNESYCYKAEQVSKRTLKNVCLDYLAATGDVDILNLAVDQFRSANNMSDQLAALSCLAHIDCSERNEALQSFYQQWQQNPLVIDKWFTVQALSLASDTVNRVKELLKHPAFTLKTPNRVYALLSAFGRNPVRFNEVSGAGYALLADRIIALHQMNPHVASHLARGFSSWKRFDEQRQSKAKAQLERILSTPNLSSAVKEIVEKILKG